MTEPDFPYDKKTNELSRIIGPSPELLPMGITIAAFIVLEFVKILT